MATRRGGRLRRPRKHQAPSGWRHGVFKIDPCPPANPQKKGIVDKLSTALQAILARPDLDVWGGKVKDAGIQPE